MNFVFPHALYGKRAAALGVDLSVVDHRDIFRDDPGAMYIQVFFNGDSDFLLGPGESPGCIDLKAVLVRSARILFNEVAPVFIAVSHES